MGKALLLYLALIVQRNWHAWKYLMSPAGSSSESMGAALCQAGISLGIALVFSLLALGLGWRILKALGAKEAVGIQDAAALALGLGTAGSLLFWLGLAGSYGVGSFIVIGALLILVGGPGAWAALRSDPLRIAPWASASSTLWKAVLLGLISYSGFNTLITSLAPPTEWDTLVYHLPIPLEYLKAGRIMEIPWIVHSHWPHLSEILYGAALAIGRDTAASALHGLVCLALLTVTFSAGRRYLDETAAWVAAALVSAQPIFLLISGTPHSDGMLAFFFFTACLSAWEWTRTKSEGWLVTAALLGGFAASAKLHGIILLAGLGLALIIHRRKEKDPLTPALKLWIIGGLVALPWFLKTWAGSGNPVWPFYSAVLGGDWGAASMEGPYLLSSRWNLTANPGLLLSNQPYFLLIPLVLLSAAARWKKRAWPGFLTFLLLPLAIYLPLVIRQQELWRFMLSFMPAMSLAIGWWVSTLTRTKGPLRWTAIGAVVFGLIPLLAVTQNNEIFAVFGATSRSRPGRSTRDLYLGKRLDHYDFFKKAAAHLHPGERTLLFREIRGYYLDADYRWGDPINQGLIRYQDMKSPEDLLRELRLQGITHVLVNEGVSLYRYSPTYYNDHVLGIMEDTLRRHATLLLEEGPLSLHALTRSP